METFVDKRMKNFTYVMLLIACVMFFLFGLFVYNEGQAVQLRNFEDIAGQYTQFAMSSLNEVSDIAKSKMHVIVNHVDVIDYAWNPSDVDSRYRSTILANTLMDDFSVFSALRVVPYYRPEKAFSIGTETLINPDDFSIPEAYQSEGDYYFSPIRYKDNKLEICLISPIYKRGKLAGYAYMLMDLSAVVERFSNRILYRDTGRMSLLDSDGTMMFVPKGQHYSDQYVKELKKALLANRDDRVEKYHIDGEEYVVYINEMNLSSTEKSFIILILSIENLYKDNQHIVISTAVIIIAFITIFAVVSMMFGYRYSRIIQRETAMAVEETLDVEVEKQTKVLKKIANTDSLTKLYNHGYIYRLLQKEIEEAKENSLPVVVMMLDVDYFKDVNDTYGHQIGDVVLKELADLMIDNIRDVDYAGRYGGEEFMIILNETHLDMGYTVAERIRKTVMDRRFTSEELHLTISIGIAEWQGEEITDFIGKVDRKLYDSKHFGRNKTTF